jgi:hypothetical protein
VQIAWQKIVLVDSDRLPVKESRDSQFCESATDFGWKDRNSSERRKGKL